MIMIKNPKIRNQFMTYIVMFKFETVTDNQLISR